MANVPIIDAGALSGKGIANIPNAINAWITGGGGDTQMNVMGLITIGFAVAVIIGSFVLAMEVKRHNDRLRRKSV